MSGYRQIHTKIWTDAWFQELSFHHKLLYVYLFSNEKASVCGLYELTLKVISFETGFDPSVIRQMLADFQTADKVEYDYEHSVIWVKNMAKYQSSTSPKLQTRILSDIRSVPDCTVKDMFNRVSIGYQCRSDTLISSQSIVKLSTVRSEESIIESDEQSLSPLSVAFCNATNIPELTGGPQRWFDALSDLGKAGVVPIDIETAVKEMRDKNYSIVTLRSIVNPAISAMSKRKNGKATNKPASTAIVIEPDWHP
jgi:hypothetical protein